MTSSLPLPPLWLILMTLIPPCAMLFIVGIAVSEPDTLLFRLGAEFAYQQCIQEIEKRLDFDQVVRVGSRQFIVDRHGLTEIRLLIEIRHPDGSGSTFFSGCTVQSHRSLDNQALENG